MTQLLCTLAQVRAMLHFDAADTSDDSLIQDVLIPAATDIVNNEAQFTFGTLQGDLKLFAHPPYLVGSTLYFRDNAVTSVDSFNTDDGTLTADVDYVLLPLNANPKTRAHLINWSSLNVTNPAGTLTVTGTLGYGSVPSDVNFAATKLVAWAYQTRDSEGNIQIVGNVTEIPAAAPGIVKTIMSKYKHNLLFA